MTKQIIHSNKKRKKGFILPLVIIVSTAALFILTPIVSRVVVTLDISHTSYRTRLAKEASRAGLAYATACYNQAGGAQTWGPAKGKPSLDPSRDCNGAVIAGKSQYLFNDGTTRSYFSVGDVSYSDTAGIEVKAQGYAEGLNLTGSVTRVYTNQLKRVSWGDGGGVIKTSEYQVGLGGWGGGCALVNSNVYCWSGNGTPTPVKKDPGVMAGEYIVQISVGDSDACAVSESGKLFCWSLSWWPSWSGNTPVQVTSNLTGKQVTAVGVSDRFRCAIADGKIYCWGQDSYGDLGNGSGLGTYGTSVSNPTLVTATYLPSGYQAVRLAKTGGITTQMCAILTTGQLYCWGGNRSSELGLNVGMYSSGYWYTSYGQVSAPYPAYNNGYLDGNGVSTVATNGSTQNASNVSCAVSNGYPYCTRSTALDWPPYNEPANGKFELVPGSYTLPMTDITVGGQGEQTCALAKDGLYCWNAGYGPASPWYNSAWNSPQKIATISGYPTTNLQSVAANWNQMCALFKDAHVFCWDNLNPNNGTLTGVTEIEQVYKLVHGFYF